MAQGREDKRLGRPPKAPTPGKRVALGLKVTSDIKQRLDEEARKSGRTQSQQAELMIERAFAEEQGFGGPEMRQIAYLMASAFATSAQFSGGGRSDWIKDRDCWIAGMVGVFRGLRAARPDLTPDDFARVIEALEGDLLSDVARREESR